MANHRGSTQRSEHSKRAWILRTSAGGSLCGFEMGEFYSGAIHDQTRGALLWYRLSTFAWDLVVLFFFSNNSLVHIFQLQQPGILGFHQLQASLHRAWNVPLFSNLQRQ